MPDKDSPTGFIQDRIENGWASRDRLPFARPGQYFVFGSDSLDNIRQYFVKAQSPAFQDKSDVFKPTTLRSEEIVLLLKSANRDSAVARLKDALGVRDILTWLTEYYADHELPPLSPRTAINVCKRMANDLALIGEHEKSLNWSFREFTFHEELGTPKNEIIGAKIAKANAAINQQCFEVGLELLTDVWESGVRSPQIKKLLILLHEQQGNEINAGQILEEKPGGGAA